MEHIIHRDCHLSSRLADYARVIILGPPVVHNGLELSIVLTGLLEPVLGIFVATIHIVDILVAQNDVKDGNKEDEGADECLSMQIFDRKKCHHANLVAHNDEECRIGGRFNQGPLRIDLLTIHVK